MEDTSGDQYIYSEWQGLMSQVFALSEEVGGSTATAVKAAMDAHGIVLSGVNSSPGPLTLQELQSDISNHQVKWKDSHNGLPSHGGGQASQQRLNKQACHTVYLYCIDSLLYN